MSDDCGSHVCELLFHAQKVQSVLQEKLNELEDAI